MPASEEIGKQRPWTSAETTDALLAEIADLRTQLSAAREETERLRAAYDQLTGEKFSDRCHVALRARAEQAEAKFQEELSGFNAAHWKLSAETLHGEVVRLDAELKRRERERLAEPPPVYVLRSALDRMTERAELAEADRSKYLEHAGRSQRAAKALQADAQRKGEALQAALDWRGLDSDGISEPVRGQLRAALAPAKAEEKRDA